MIAKIDLRPYIKDPSLFITENLLESLKEELKIYESVSRSRPEYLKYVQEIKKELKMKHSFKINCTN